MSAWSAGCCEVIEMEYEKVKVYGVGLADIEQILREEGFQDTLLQVQKPGQVFGLVKRLDPPWEIWEMHVRGFEDGHLEAEIEISRDYLEHLDDRYRRSAGTELSQLLSKHGVPHVVERGGNVKLDLEVPETLTPWKMIAVALGVIALALYVLSKKEE